MRLLRWLIGGAGLSLFALSLALHYRIDARFDFGAPPAPSPTASDGTIRVKKFGLEQELIVKVFDARDEAERICGRDNIMQWEKITRTESKDGRYSCRSDLP
jgi:hypothetical protein